MKENDIYQWIVEGMKNISTCDEGSGTKLNNKKFSIVVAKLISSLPESFAPQDIQLLTDCEHCKDNFNCHFPVLREIPNDIQDLKTITHINGYRRYYSDIFVVHSHNRYLISNDWYHGSKFSNQNLFKNWLLSKLLG